MQDYRNLIDIINQNIKRNGNQHITGDLMNSILKLIINFAVDVNQGFNGILKPTTPANDITGFWVATAGNYPNFNTIINDNQLGFVYYDNAQGRYITEKVDLVDLEAIKDYVDTRLVNANIGFGGEITSLNQQPSIEGMYIPTIDGTYPNFGNLNYNSKVDGLSIFVYKNEEFSKINVPLNIQLSNIVEYGSNKAVTSIAVEKFAVKKINNIAELRNTKGEYEGQVIELLGYYNAGDKEPIQYVWSNNIQTDNKGTIISTNNGSWEHYYDVFLNVEIFGCNADIEDNRLMINDAINALKEGETLVINNNYKVVAGSNYASVINIKSKMNLLLNGIIELVPNNYDNCRVIGVSNCSDVRIYGRGGVIGDKYTHLGTSGEWGHGLFITKGSHDIYIDGLSFSKCWGDGIYLGGNDGDLIIYNIYIDNVDCYDNRRQGMSITYAYNCYINNSKFRDTNGTLPMAGIDFEPNLNTYVNNIYVNNCEITGNAGSGVDLYTLNSIGSINSIKIEGCVIANNEDAIKIITSKNITLQNNRIVNNRRYGINLLRNYEDIYIYSNDIFKNNYYGVAVVTTGQQQVSKNVYIENNKIVDNSVINPNKYDAIRIDNLDANYGIENIYINYNIIYNSNATKSQRYGISKSGNSLIKNVKLIQNEITNMGITSVTGSFNLHIDSNNYTKKTIGTIAPTSNNLGDLYYQTVNNQLRFYNGNEWVDIMRMATQNLSGNVLQSKNVANITTSDATDLATALVLVNELKAKLNAKLTADRNSGQQAN